MAHITLQQLTTVLERIASWGTTKFAGKNADSGKLEYADMPVVVLASMGAELDGTETQITTPQGSTIFQPAAQGVGARIMFLTSDNRVVKISDPVSGVIYCNAYTGLLYRWNPTTSKMVSVGGGSGSGDGLLEVYVGSNDYSSLDALNSIASAGIYRIIDQTTQNTIGILVVSCDDGGGNSTHLVTQWLFSNLGLNPEYSGSIYSHYTIGRAHIIQRFYNAGLAALTEIPLHTWSDWKVYGLTLDEMAQFFAVKTTVPAAYQPRLTQGTGISISESGTISVETGSVAAGVDEPVSGKDVKAAIDNKLTVVTVDALVEGDALGEGGVAIAHLDGVTSIIFGSTGGMVEMTKAPTITVADSGLSKVVTIANHADETGADIYYTLDGTDPTTNSTKYDSSSPITLNESKTVKAIAISEGKLASAVATENVVVPANDWIDGVRLNRSMYSDNMGDTDLMSASGYSVSPYIPVSNGDDLWVWCGIQYEDTYVSGKEDNAEDRATNKCSIKFYDSNLRPLTYYATLHKCRRFTLNNANVAYIRFNASTTDKEKCFVRKYTSSDVKDPTGTWLLKGNKITSGYDTLLGFVFFAAGTGGTAAFNIGNLYKCDPSVKIESMGYKNTYRPSSTEENSKCSNLVVSRQFSIADYDRIEIGHKIPVRKPLVKFYNQDGTNYDAFYRNGWEQSGSDYIQEPRVWNRSVDTAVWQESGYMRVQFSGPEIHSCYIKLQYTDQNEEVQTEYIFKGCDVVDDTNE